MTNISRRALLLSTALIGLTGCVTSATGTVTIDPQVLADANGLVNVLLAEIPQVIGIDPGLIPADTASSILANLGLAHASLATLSSVTLAPQGATVVQQVEAVINAALNAIVPVLPAAVILYPALAPAVPLFNAGVALVPAIEAYINAFLPTTTAAVALRAKLVGPTLTYGQARGLLNIPTVK